MSIATRYLVYIFLLLGILFWSGISLAASLDWWPLIVGLACYFLLAKATETLKRTREFQKWVDDHENEWRNLK